MFTFVVLPTLLRDPQLTKFEVFIVVQVSNLLPPSLSMPYSTSALAGAMAGSLHAVSGPDHLAALLPMALGQRFFSASRVGAVWGIGHGVGASLMGGVAWFVTRSTAVGKLVGGAGAVETLSEWMELAVGLTLVVIGILGLRKSLAWERGGQRRGVVGEGDVELGERNKGHGHDLGIDHHGHGHGHGHAHNYVGMGKRAMLMTGVVHGFSGSGHLLGVIPAMMLTRGPAAAYLAAFCLGTCAAMAVFTGAIGQASLVLGRSLNRPDLPRHLSAGTSIIALLVGLVWIMNGYIAVSALSTTTSGSIATAMAAGTGSNKGTDGLNSAALHNDLTP